VGRLGKLPAPAARARALLPGRRRRDSAGISRKVVVLGAGFAGLSAAQALDRTLKVTVVDPHVRFDFLPNVHELISGAKQPADLQLPRAALVHRAGHTFLRDRAMDLDLSARRVTLAGGRALDYDYLLVACGGEGSLGLVPGAAAHAMAFKSVGHCAAIGRRLAGLMNRGSPARVAIVGAGLEGIEALGEILRLGDAPGGKPVEVHMLEASATLMPAAPPALDAEVRRLCRRRPVTFHTGVRVACVEPGRICLQGGGEVPAELMIWTAGLRPRPLLRQAGLSPRGGEWAPVRPTLQSQDRDEVLVAGDAVALPRPVEKQAYHALDMGRRAGLNIARLVAGRQPRRFRPSPKPQLISFGDLDCFMVLGDTVVAGKPLLALKEGVYQLVMARLDPPTGLGSIRQAVRRARQGMEDLTGPGLSLATLARQADVRILKNVK